MYFNNKEDSPNKVNSYLSQNLSLIENRESEYESGNYIRLTGGEYKKWIQIQCKSSEFFDASDMKFRLFIDVNEDDRVQELAKKIELSISGN